MTEYKFERSPRGFLDEQNERAEELREQATPESVAEAIQIHEKVIDDIRLLSAFVTKGEEKAAFYLLVIAEALQHLAICYKHLWQEVARDVELRKKYRGEMLATVRQGINLPIPQEDRAVFYMRLGDCHDMAGELDEAVEQYYLATQLVRKGTAQEAEFYGHLAAARAKVASQLRSKAEALLFDIEGEGSWLWKSYTTSSLTALKAAEEAMGSAYGVFREVKTTLVPWHYWIVLSGLWSREREVVLVSDQKFKANFLALKYAAAAWWLAVRHDKPKRWQQLWEKVREKASAT